MLLLVVFVLLAMAAMALLASRLLSFAQSLQEELIKPIPVALQDFSSVDPIPLPSIFNAPSKSLSIVVPAYNEEDRLGATLEETISFLQRSQKRVGSHYTFEIIVVDDGSKDGTIRVAQDFVKRYGFDTVRLLRVKKNRGKGHAVRRGMMIARGATCLMMDADGATRVSDLEVLERTLLEKQKSSKGGDQAAVFGSRAHMAAAAMAKRHPIRNFLTRGFHLLVNLVVGGKIKDTQCGFKLFTRHAAAQVFSNQRLQRWCFDVELLYLLQQFEIPVGEEYVHWTEMPGSKIRPTSILHMAFELLTVKVAYTLMGLWKVYSEAEVEQFSRGQ